MFVFDENRDEVSDFIQNYARDRVGQRGIETYLWLIDVMRSAHGSSSVILRSDLIQAVLTDLPECAVVHCISGDMSLGAQLVDAARGRTSSKHLRGLALPGDRLTKNLFEEARLPAQVLVH